MQLDIAHNPGSCIKAEVYTVDTDVLAEMEALLGRPRLLVLLTDFRTEIVRLFLSEGLAPDTLSSNAHGLVGSSGMLGFTELSRACAALEEGCRRQADPDGLRRIARDAGHSALEALAVVMPRLA